MHKIIMSLGLLAAIAVFATFGGVNTAEAGTSCNPKIQSCIEQVQTTAASLLRKMRKGHKLPTTVANCPKVDALSHEWAPKCRQIKADCRAISHDGQLTGSCKEACALCDIREAFVIGWKRFCDKAGYVSPRGHRQARNY